MSTSSTLAPLSGVTLPQGQSTTTADLAAGGPRRRPIDRAPLLSVDAIRQLHADRDAKKPKNTTSSGGEETGDSSSNAPNWSVSYHRQALSTASEGTPGVLAAARNVLSSAASPHATMYQSPQRRRLAEAQLENEKSANEILDLEKRNREQQSFDISDISGAAVGNSSLRSSLAGPDVGSLEYLRNHSVVPLFNELLAELLAQKPENPIDYLLENLKEIQGDVSQARQQLERKSVHQLVKGRKEESSIADEALKSSTPPHPDAEGEADSGATRVVDTTTPSEAFAAIVREGTDDVPLVASVLAVAAGGSSIAAKEEEVEPITNTVEEVSEEEAPVDVEVVGDNKEVPNPEGSPAPQTVVPTLTTTEEVSPFENITYSTTNSNNNQNHVDEDEKEEEVEDSSTSVDRHRSGGNIVESNLLDGYSSDQLDRMSSAVPYLFLMTQSGSTAVEGVSVSMAPVGIQLLLRSFIVPNMQRSPSLPRSGPLNPIAVKKLVCLSALAQSATSSEQPNLGIDLLIKAAGTAIQLEGFSFPTSLAASPRAIDMVSTTTTNPPPPVLTSRAEDEEEEDSTRAVELTTSPTREGAQQDDDVEEDNDKTKNTESKNEVDDSSSEGKIVNTGFKGVDAVAQAAQSMNNGKPLAGLDMLVSACESASTSANGSRVGSATTGNNHNKNRIGGDVQPEVVETLSSSSNHEAIDVNGSSTQDSTANAAAAAVQDGDAGDEQAATTGGSNDGDEAVMYPCLALLSALLGTTGSHIQYLTEAAQQRRGQQQ